MRVAGGGGALNLFIGGLLWGVVAIVVTAKGTGIKKKRGLHCMTWGYLMVKGGAETRERVFKKNKNLI
jgi:hypothetical protein